MLDIEGAPRRAPSIVWHRLNCFAFHARCYHKDAVTSQRRLCCMVLTALLGHALVATLSFAQSRSAASSRDQELNRQFQAAVAQYDAGHFPEAATQLEKLLREVPDSFEAQELLGMVYAGQSHDELARPHLEAAVRLKPTSAAAHINLAANLVRLGDVEGARQQLKRAVVLEPKNYDANHNLGEIYIKQGKLPDAIPFLKQAQQINPASYDNGYDLALAYLLTDHNDPARQVVRALLEGKDTAELHNLLGQIEEKDGNFVAAANEFETAAHQDPSESNLFDWASELLLHRTLEPAIEVFRSATDRYPASARLAIGLGIAYYSRGIYDEAVKSLLRAADLSPSDPRCYLFLSKAYDSSPSQADEVIQRFRRFSELQPNDARAQYYYAISLWNPRIDWGRDLESAIRLSTGSGGGPDRAGGCLQPHPIAHAESSDGCAVFRSTYREALVQRKTGFLSDREGPLRRRLSSGRRATGLPGPPAGGRPRLPAKETSDQRVHLALWERLRRTGESRVAPRLQPASLGRGGNDILGGV